MKQIWLNIHARLIRLVVGKRPVMMNIHSDKSGINLNEHKEIVLSACYWALGFIKDNGDLILTANHPTHIKFKTGGDDDRES